MKSENLQSKWPIVGNGQIVNFLIKSIKNNSISGTYIFYGPDNLGKNHLAHYFAKVLLCEKKGETACEECASCKRFETGALSDVISIKREEDKKNISIEQVRDLIQRLSMSSFLNSYKIGIVNEAHTLSLEAANALLKTLEEPKKDVVVILTTSALDLLPKTIVSRSQILRFNPVDSDLIYDYLVNEEKITRSAAKNFARLSLGRPALALKFLKNREFLDSYLKTAKIFLNFFDKDINDRFSGIKEIVGEKGNGQENARSAEEAIKIWRGLLRDLLLLGYGHNDLIRNEIFNKELSEIGKKKTDFLNLFHVLRNAEIYLLGNVNPKLVLEQIAISL